MAKLCIHLVFYLIFFTLHSLDAAANEPEPPLQEFACTGLLKSLTIFNDATRPNGRRIKTLYVDNSGKNEFATRVPKGGYISYQYEGNKEEIRYYSSGMRLEFWEGGAKVSDDFAKCAAQEQEKKSSGVVRETEWKTYECGDEIVTVSQVSSDMVRVKSRYNDGTSSEDFMSVLRVNGLVKWITEESQRREVSEWGKSQGPGFSSFHLRYDQEKDQIQFWSQGGGKMESAKMYKTCSRKH